MKDLRTIRLFAEQLHGEIFGMRHGLELGPIEEEMPRERLRPILAAKIKAAGVSPTDAQLDVLVRDFPVIDVWPDDAHPNESMVFERETLALTELLGRVVPDLANG